MKSVAAIGAGAWGRNVVRTLHEIGVLSAVAEPSDAIRSELAGLLPGVEVLADYQPLLSRPDIQAVAIATPAITHHPIASEFLRSGRDVFVEKPMTMTVAEAEELVEVADRHGRILMTGHLLLYTGGIRLVRKCLEDGLLGRVFSLHQERMKLGRARTAENALWSLGVHDVAALLYIAGQTPIDVKFSGNAFLTSGVEDDTYLHLTFADGSIAHLHNSWLWPEDRRCLTIVGEKGMLVFDEKAGTVTHVRKSIGADLQNIDNGREVLHGATSGAQPLRTELEHFLDCVRTRKTPLTDGRSGLEVIRVLEAARAQQDGEAARGGTLLAGSK